MITKSGQLLIPTLILLFVIISMVVFAFVIVNANREQGRRPFDLCLITPNAACESK